jgi:glyoxylate reductase
MNQKPIVYVARKLPKIALELLQPHVQVRMHAGELPPSRDELLTGVRDAAGILSLLSDRIDGPVMDAAGASLRVISNFAVGTNNIDLAAARARGIAVGNTPDVLTDATADVAVSLLLACSRRLKQAAQDAATGGWRTWEPTGWLGLELSGKTLGIIGMGRIGAAVAGRLHGGWQQRVLYTARSPHVDVEQQLGARRVELDELLREADFISIHAPLTRETEKMIGARELSLMKPTAVLVNTARGEIIDQQALIDTLTKGSIFAAGLDVCVPEPLPLDNPLLSLDNCLVLPHIGSATIQARDAMATRAANNILQGIRQQPLPYPVA